ncbi:hypothetical protein CASFOL_008544 [Castilleja foliolosa]|uniref:Uncharacterized protein n=1 Tax=Castilleja foliolosa TaxID=1961234 RepID=A0ABD3E3C0_9LAMI
MCSDFGGGGVSVGDLSELKGYLLIVGDSARGSDGCDKRRGSVGCCWTLVG